MLTLISIFPLFFKDFMENVNKLICALIALQNFCKDIHYNSKGDAFYSKHLLADRVQDNISDYIDRIKEVSILGNDKETLPSSEYLQKASYLIPEIRKADKENFTELASLLINILALIENIKPTTAGENNLYGAIAEDLQNSLGLINRQVK